MSAASATKGKERPKLTESGKSRTYVKQTDVPKYPLREALRVAEAISEQYAKQPTKPLDIAIALEINPSGRTFEDLTGASIAYGLTEEGPQADQIVLTDLGRRIVAPTTEGDDLAAKREAVLRPRVIRQFLSKYNGSSLPKDNIAYNVLEEMGVAAGATERVLKIILDNAKHLGLIREFKDKSYVSLDSPVAAPVEDYDEGAAPVDRQVDELNEGSAGNGQVPGQVPQDEASPRQDLTRNGRVFITHGSNKDIVAQIKELLTFGGLEPVVSVEKETVAKPVPDKVMDDMRSCGAAIVHVGSELKLIDQDGNERRMVNPNVLIEIGAAMALYGRRFILLVERGVTLPSNLQGLYEVRYEGEKLDYDATMKLLKAFNEFRG